MATCKIIKRPQKYNVKVIKRPQKYNVKVIKRFVDEFVIVDEVNGRHFNVVRDLSNGKLKLSRIYAINNNEAFKYNR